MNSKDKWVLIATLVGGVLIVTVVLWIDILQEQALQRAEIETTEYEKIVMWRDDLKSDSFDDACRRAAEDGVNRGEYEHLIKMYNEELRRQVIREASK